MIEFDCLSVTGPHGTIIDEFSFTCDEDTLTIEGGIGAGKSILARAIAGAEPQPGIVITGRVILGPHEISFASAHRPPSRIGYVPQITANSFIGPTVFSEVEASAYCSASSASAASARIAQWRAGSPLSAFANFSPQKLSGGQQRLLALELLVLSDPDHIVVDSGSDALDAIFVRYSKQLIQSWMGKSHGRRVIQFVNSIRSPDLLGEQPDYRLRRRTFEPGENRRSAGQHSLPGPPILEVDGASFAFPNAKAPLLSNISFVIREGEVVGMRGANGIGKSTLLRLAAGLVTPRAGRVRVFGESIESADWPGTDDGVLYLPQEPELAGVAWLAERHAGGRPAVASGISFWDGRTDTYWLLSSGERALAALLEQWQHGPRLWLLDEPTSRIPADVLSSTIERGRKQNPRMSALIISHNEEFLKRSCDRTMTLTENGIQLA